MTREPRAHKEYSVIRYDENGKYLQLEGLFTDYTAAEAKVQEIGGNTGIESYDVITLGGRS